MVEGTSKVSDSDLKARNKTNESELLMLQHGLKTSPEFIDVRDIHCALREDWHHRDLSGKSVAAQFGMYFGFGVMVRFW